MDDSPWMPPGAASAGGAPPPPPSSPPAAPPGSPTGSPFVPPAAPPAAPEAAPFLPPAAAPAPPPPSPAPSPSPWSAAASQPVLPAQPTLPAATVPQPPVVDPQPVGSIPIDSPLSSAAEAPPVVPVGRSGRSKVLVGGAVVAVVAVGAAGVFAVQSFGDGAAGGAATPDELATALMTAVENEDVLGLVDVLSPGERDLLRQPAIDLVAELTRLEVLSVDADLARIAGLDVVLEGERVAVTQTNVDDIVNVRMTADAEITVDGALIPVGDLVTDNMDADMVAEMRNSVETAREPFELELTAVRDDDRWYFSLFHTAAEQLRAEEEPAPDIPLTGIGASGATSPEGAVDQLLNAVEQLDLELMMQTLNPGEAAALQRYAPLFLPDAQAELDEIPLDWQITTREFRVEGEGRTRTAFIDAITIEGRVEDEEFTIGFAGDCVSAEFAGETFEQCGTGVSDEELDDILADTPALQEFVDVLREAFADMEPVGLELRETDGAWFVSPVSTLNEAVLTFLRALDRQEIDRLIELGEDAFSEIFDLALGGLGGALGDDPFADDPMFDDSMFDDSMFDETALDSMGDMGGTFGDTYEPAAWEACYSEIDPVAAATCFDGYVQAGEIDAYMVPVELRFPECGFDARWTRELYTMPDAEFIAAIEGAAPCFQALVDAGTITEFEVPSEVLNLECYEGRNWYNVFDDPAYDDRYWACVDALYAE